MIPDLGKLRCRGTRNLMKDDDDMFSEAFAPAHRQVSQIRGPLIDDQDGYLITQNGDVLLGKYRVVAQLGKGMFSSVVRVECLETGTLHALKILRANPVMYRAGLKEHVLLERLHGTNSDLRRYIVQYGGKLEVGKHLCLLFENMDLNMRELLKRYGKDGGLSLEAVRVYAKQLFGCLALLQSCQVIHGDIKPDNILVTEERTSLRLCDFGTGCMKSEAEVAPYLQSRFYRAPEVILGLPYGCEIDCWSVATTLYELYTGQVLFPGRNNNDMLRLHQELKGSLPTKWARRGTQAARHFQGDQFVWEDHDLSTGLMTLRRPLIIKTKSIAERLVPFIAPDEQAASVQFADLLEKCLYLSAERRLTPVAALQHLFFQQK